MQTKKRVRRNIGIQSKSNPKIFWSHICSKFKAKNGGAPPLQDEKDETSAKFDDKEKASILQKQFVSVFTKEPNDGVPVLDKKADVNLPDIYIYIYIYINIYILYKI